MVIYQEHFVKNMIDSHVHLIDARFDEDREEVFKRSNLRAMVNICTDERTLELGLAFRKEHPRLFLAGATTPHDVLEDGEKMFPRFAAAAKAGQLCALGETGLDYYYEHSPKGGQQEFMLRYFALAQELDLPVVIHCRDAFDDLFHLAKAHYPSSKLVIHCFTGGREEAKRALDLGWMISISGIATYKRSAELREAIVDTPLEHLLVETDAPYLAPQSRRGKRCEPKDVFETAGLIAELKGMPKEEVESTLDANAVNFFKLEGV